MARELTKKHEEQIGPTIGKVLEHFSENTPKGEFTLVLGGATTVFNPQTTHEELLNQMELLLSEGLSPSNAAKELAAKSGASRNFLYSLIHQNKKKHGFFKSLDAE